MSIIVVVFISLVMLSILVLTYSNRKDKENYHYSTFILCGTARDIEKTWPTVQLSLGRIMDATIPDVCIVESNSSDQTLKLLQNWAKDNERINIISLGKLKEPSRTKRLATCRNTYLDYARRKCYRYMIVVDLDDVLNIESNFQEQLQHCFSRKNDWDAVTANRKELYYDIWALRSKAMGIDFDCWKKVGSDKSPKIIQKYVTNFQKNIPRTRPWIPVESAFCGLAIYNIATLDGHRYNGDDICEHVPFHQGLRMFIVPSLISG
jgi:hypothetical protein